MSDYRDSPEWQALEETLKKMTDDQLDTLGFLVWVEAVERELAKEESSKPALTLVSSKEVSD